MKKSRILVIIGYIIIIACLVYIDIGLFKYGEQGGIAHGLISLLIAIPAAVMIVFISYRNMDMSGLAFGLFIALLFVFVLQETVSVKTYSIAIGFLTIIGIIFQLFAIKQERLDKEESKEESKDIEIKK